MSMKQAGFVWLILLSVCSACPGEDRNQVEQELTVCRAELSRIQTDAAALRTVQPDFADWVDGQAPIYRNLEKSICHDAIHAPERCASMIADYQYLLRRMAAEVAYFRTQQDPAKNGSLNVRDFGARGDGTTDDAPAFRKAFAAANTGTRRQVKIPAGRYRLKADTASSVFTLDGFHDVEIAGEKGTVLIQDSPRPSLFRIENSDNVRLCDLQVTAAYSPFTTGMIEKVENPNLLTVKIDPGMGSPLAPVYQECQSKGLVRLASGQLQEDGITPAALSIASHVLKPQVSSIRGDRYLFRLPGWENAENTYRPGMRIIYYARDYGNQKIIGFRSRHIRLKRISIDTSSSMAFLFNQCESYFITDCTVKARRGTYVATCADGLYLYNGMLGGYVARNTICDLGDDYLNIHTQIRPVFWQEGNVLYTSCDLAQGLGESLTRVALVRRSRKESWIDSEYPVQKIERVTRERNGKRGEYYKLHLAGKVPDLVTVANQAEKKAPAFDFLSFPELQNHGMVITENTFSNGVSRILPAGNNIVFSDNRVDDALGWIMLTLIEDAIGHWDEVFLPRNVTFNNNRFTSLHKSIFFFDGKQVSPDPAKHMAHFFLEGNSFRVKPWADSQRPLFVLDGVDHLEFLKNKIDAPDCSGAIFDVKNCRGLVGCTLK